MSKKITRRAAVAAIALPSLSSGAGSVVASDALQALGDDLDKALAVEAAAMEEFSAAEAAVGQAARASRPLVLASRPRDEPLGIPGAGDVRTYGASHVEVMRRGWQIPEARHHGDGMMTIGWHAPSDEAKERAAEIVAAFDRWDAALAQLRGVEAAASERSLAAHDVVREVVRKIAAVRATSSADLAVKARALAWTAGRPVCDLLDGGRAHIFDDEDQWRLIASLLRDALAA